MKRRALLYSAMAILVALYVYDRSNRTETTLPAVVETIASSDDTEGAESWHVIARIGDNLVDLAPVLARPNLKPGDRICVTRVSRTGQGDEFRRANAGTEC